LRNGPRSVRVALALATVAAAAATSVYPAAAAASTSHTGSVAATSAATPATNGQPIAFGADLKPAKGQSLQQTIAGFEATTGRKLAYTRDYLLWDSPFPTDYESWLAARGTVPFISVSPHTMANGTVTWASIANAKPGDAVYTQMVAWADKIKAFGYPVYFAFNHEPEAAASTRYGTAPEFIAAWQNFHRVFDTEHVTNARWIWTMTAYAFTVTSSDRRWGSYWYPGDAWVDALGADAYTAYTCDNPGGAWHTLAYQIAGFTAFGAQHPTKPLWLPEWGVVEDSAQAGRKAQFITEAESLFKDPAYSQYAGIAYFDETRPGTACVWDVSSSTSAQTAYNTMARDAFYGGSATWTPDPDTTPPAVAMTAPADGATISGKVALAASASDDRAVGSVSFAVDGTSLSTDTTAPYAASLDTTTLADGSHTLTATAKDTSGNSATSAPITVTVTQSPPDTTPPTVSISSPADGSTVSGVTAVTATAADDVAVASVGFFVDGALISTATSAPYSASFNAATLSVGSHSLTAVATDTSSNATTSAVTHVTVPSAATHCVATPAGSTEQSANLSLEANQSGWTGLYNSTSANTRVQVAGGSYDGSWAMQIAPKAGSSGTAGLNQVSPYWVTSTVANHTYTGSAMVRSAEAGLPVTILLRETTSSGAAVAYANKTVTLSDTAWHPVSVAYTAKNAGDQIRYSLYATFPKAGTSMLGDCLSLQSTP
jgi:beta-mannanase